MLHADPASIPMPASPAPAGPSQLGPRLPSTLQSVCLFFLQAESRVQGEGMPVVPEECCPA